jgi:hypothetical protein
MFPADKFSEDFASLKAFRLHFADMSLSSAGDKSAPGQRLFSLVGRPFLTIP